MRDEHAYFPLAAGFRWGYELVDLAGGEGNYTFTLVSRGRRPLPELGRDGIVVDETSPQGTHPTAYFEERAYLVKVLGLAYGKEGALIWTGSDNVRQFGWSGVQNLQRMLPRDTAVGVHWDDDAQILNARVRTSSTVVAEEDVRVPAGHFEGALRVDSTTLIDPILPQEPATFDPANPMASLVEPLTASQARYSTSDWYARGVGLVRSITRQEGDRPIVEIRLVSIEPTSRAGAPQTATN